MPVKEALNECKMRCIKRGNRHEFIEKLKTTYHEFIAKFKKAGKKVNYLKKGETLEHFIARQGKSPLILKS